MPEWGLDIETSILGSSIAELDFTLANPANPLISSHFVSHYKEPSDKPAVTK